jgi:hypothetical protein
MHMDSTMITIIGASAATASAVASVINLINSKIELRKMKEKLNKGLTTSAVQMCYFVGQRLLFFFFLLFRMALSYGANLLPALYCHQCI